MYFNIMKLFLRNMVLCTYQCYAREGVTQGVGIFVKCHSPGTTCQNAIH